MGTLDTREVQRQKIKMRYICQLWAKEWDRGLGLQRGEGQFTAQWVEHMFGD